MENREMVIFGLGCAAGVAAAMMLTSKSGRKGVKYLCDKAEQGTKTIRESVDSASEAVTGAASRGVKAVKYQAENIGAAVEAGKAAFKAAREMTP